MAVDTYYFDGHISITDPNSNWANDANAFDGNTATISQATSIGDTSVRFLYGKGTTAPASGTTITAVRVRMFGAFTADAEISGAVYTESLGELLGTAKVDESTGTSGSWGAYTTLSTPTGGWNWDKLNKMEVKAYLSDLVFGSRALAKIEIEVTHDDPAPSTGTGTMQHIMQISGGLM